MMSLHQADKVGHSFPSKPLLLVINPLPPSRGWGSTSTWTAKSFDQAPSLASHPLDAEHPPHLPHEDDHLSLFTPFAPPLSSFQQLLVHCPRGGKVMDQEVNILRCLSPCSRSSFKLDLCTVSTINLVLSSMFSFRMISSHNVFILPIFFSQSFHPKCFPQNVFI